MTFGVDGIPRTRTATTNWDGTPLVSGDEPATRSDGTYKAGENVWIFSYFKDTEKNTFGSYAANFLTNFTVCERKVSQTRTFHQLGQQLGLDFGFLYEACEKTTLACRSATSVKPSTGIPHQVIKMTFR
jgi:hypothetical protein